MLVGGAGVNLRGENHPKTLFTTLALNNSKRIMANPEKQESNC